MSVAATMDPVVDNPAFLRPSRRSGAVTILVVEDDACVRAATQAFLRREGYRVLTADSEPQALWVWEHHQAEIDLLFTDMMIPHGATGSALAARFLREKPDLRVLFTSGFGPEVGEDDPDFPVNAPFLPKPCPPERLRETLAALLAAPAR